MPSRITVVESNKNRNTEAVSRHEHDALHKVADALPVSIARVDRDERYRFNNLAYENWFQLRPDELYGRTVREVLGEELYSKSRPHLQAAFGGMKETFEVAVPDKEGRMRVAQVSYIPHFDPTGQVDELYVLVVDITDHRRAQEEIRRLNTDLEKRVQERTSQLESTNRELEAFCYSVSHDLRAPLRAIRGFTEVLTEQYGAGLDARGQDFLRRVREASSQMDKLIEDLLKLSRGTRGELLDQEVSLSAIAEEIVFAIKTAEPSRKVDVKIAPGLNAIGDGRLLRQVLDNLLRNAWKFTGPQAHARIEFGQTKETEPAFFVRDNGVGFDMAYAGRLFGVFQRLHPAGDFPGSGIGLAIVQRIINRHGGRVWAEAAVDKGATFYFTLPARRDK